MASEKKYITDEAYQNTSSLPSVSIVSSFLPTVQGTFSFEKYPGNIWIRDADLSRVAAPLTSSVVWSMEKISERVKGIANNWFYICSSYLMFFFRAVGIFPCAGGYLVYTVLMRILSSLLLMGVAALDFLTYVDTLVTTKYSKMQVTIVSAMFIVHALGGLIRTWVLIDKVSNLGSVMEGIGVYFQSVPCKNRAPVSYVLCFTIAWFGMGTFLLYASHLLLQTVYNNGDVVFGFRFRTLYARLLQISSNTISSNLGVYSTVLFGFLALSLGAAFQQNQQMFTTHFREYKAKRIDYNEFVGGIYKCRMEHLTLSDIVTELDGIFAPSNFVALVSDVLVVILLVSVVMGVAPPRAGYMFSNTPLDVFYLTLCALVNFCFLMQRMLLATYAHNKAHSVEAVLHRISETIDCGTADLEVQMTKTLRRLHSSPVVFTAWNILHLNTELILTVIGILVTYLVVVYEMNSKDDTAQILQQNCTANNS